MPSPGAPAPPRVSIEDSYLELLVDTLDGLDLLARGLFLQRYFRVIAHLDLREAQCLQIWDDMLASREMNLYLGGTPIVVVRLLPFYSFLQNPPPIDIHVHLNRRRGLARGFESYAKLLLSGGPTSAPPASQADARSAAAAI